jgi:hypothetical protein
MMGPVAIDSLPAEEFGAGLQAGLLALVLGAVAGVGWRLVLRAPLPAAGLLLAGGAAWGLREAVALPPGLVEALTALAGAGLVASILPKPQIAGPILAVPGAWILAYRADVVDVDWIRALVAAAAVVGGMLVADFDRRWRATGFSPVLIGVAAVGVYFTVPDTEQATVLLGVALPLALLGGPPALARLGSAGSYAAVGLVAWTVAAGGVARPSSIIGGVACLGLLIIEPLARSLAPPRALVLGALERRWWGVVPVATGQLLLVFIASRGAGLRPAMGEAVVVVMIELAVAAAIIVGYASVPSTRSGAARLPEGGGG